MDLHFCLPASGAASHANIQLLPPLSKVTFTWFAKLISEQKVVSKKDYTTVCPTQPQFTFALLPSIGIDVFLTP